MTETETVETLFERGIERYQAGESPEILLPVFKEMGEIAPKNAAVWTSLAWLYLLANKPKSALKMAQKAVKCDRKAPQARVNLALAMLETKTKGVRPHIDAALQIMAASDEIRNDVRENIQDGFERKPDWESLKRVNKWLFD